MEDLDDDFLTWLQPPQEHHSDHSENDYEDELYVDGMEVEDDNQDEADEDFEADGPASSKATGTRGTKRAAPTAPTTPRRNKKAKVSNTRSSNRGRGAKATPESSPGGRGDTDPQASDVEQSVAAEASTTPLTPAPDTETGDPSVESPAPGASSGPTRSD